MRLSVAVTVRNDRANLEALLDSLATQTRAPDEAVIVDAGSTDGTFEAARDFAKRAPFPVVAVQELGNRGVGRTRCLALATGDLVAFVDSDCTVAADWVARWHDGWARESARDPRPLGALGGANHTPPGSTPLQQAIDDVMSPMEEQSFHGINTINCVYLREAALAAGAFDATLHTAEDPDLNAKIAKLGYRLLRIDNPCWHKRRDAWGKLVKQHYEYGKGAWTLLTRHPEYFPWQERWVAPVGVGASLVLVALAVALSPWFLLALAAGLVGVPLWVHRRWVALFARERGVGGEWLRRLAVLWIVYVPYHLGVLAARMGRA